MRITDIWRFPVKSLQGERLESTTIDMTGIAGDRAWGIFDAETGKTLTARRVPEMLFGSARVVDGEVVVTTRDGEVGDDEGLSKWLGRDVKLASALEVPATYETQLDFETEVVEWFDWQGPEGSFHDSTKTRVSIVSAPTMRDWDIRRFRINVITDGGDEDALVGSTIQIGDGPVLEVLKQVDRCVMVTRPQPDGIDRDLDVLRTIHAERGGNLGIGANVVSAGSIAVGDQITTG